MGRQKTPKPGVGSPTPEGGKPKRPRDDGTGYGERAWDRQPGETWSAWNAFRVYRDLGPERSLAAVEQAIRQSEEPIVKPVEPGKRRSINGRLGLWSRENRWIERADAYEAWIDQHRQEALAKSRVRDTIEWHEFRRVIARHAREDYLAMREAIMAKVGSNTATARDLQSLSVAREKAIALAREAGISASDASLASPDSIPPDLAADLNALLVLRVERQQAEPEREA